jgi:uncharacterized protein (DUF433 family)
MSQTELTQQSPVEVPLYTPWDAARYLHVSLWALPALTGRFRSWPAPRWYFDPLRRGFPYPPPVEEEWPLRADRDRISFRRFAELFVRAAALQTLAGWSPVGERARDDWESLHHAIWRGLEDGDHEPVPFDTSPIEERVNRLVEPFAPRMKAEPLALLRKWTRLRLERVEACDGEPVRLYPFSRDPAEQSPRVIVLDPGVRFGRPTIADQSIPTDGLFERYQAGDSVAELAADYELAPDAVEEAIRYEALSPAPLVPFPGW